MSFPSRLALGVLVLFAVACGKKDPVTPIGVSSGSPTMYAQRHAGSPQHVVGNLITAVGESSMGPYLSKRGAGPTAAGMVAWLTTAEGTGRRILVEPVDGNGSPRGGESVVANVPVDTLMLVLRPMRGAAPGFVAAWTSLTDRGKSLWAVAISDNGSPRGKPVEITRSDDDISWVDVIPTDRGAVCLWAEETRGGEANLISASLDTDGKVRESAVRVARGIVGWSTVAIPTGIGISTVAAAPIDAKAKAGPARGRGGPLTFQRLDADGHTSGKEITITSAPVVSGDVEVVRDDKRLLFAWTDRGTDEPAVALATLDDATGQIEGPRRVAEARGGAALLGLASGPAGVGVMFEAPARRKDESRHVHVAKVGERLYLEHPPFTIDTIGKPIPELAANSTGFSVLASALDCAVDSNECASAPTTATVWRMDAKMALVQREPLNFGADPASIAWNLACEEEQCITLAASGAAPSRIRVALVKPRNNAKAAPLPDEVAAAVPVARIDDITAVASGESIIHLATTHMPDGGVLVATLGAKNAREKSGDSKDAKEPVGTVSTRVVDDQGVAGPVQVITPSALTTGGVAIAFSDKPEQGGAMVWAGRESGTPQLHITRIDRKGRRQEDSLLTGAKGEKSDVTITWAGNGYIVAWVDGRDGNGEIYATKIQPDLTRISREERITTAPGDASDLVAASRGDNVFLAWADPRESPSDGMADVFITAVKKHDAKRVFDEQRVLATAAHSRTPTLKDSPDGVNIAWIEESPEGSESPNGGSFGAFLARVDDAGKTTLKPARIPLSGAGAATAVALEGGATLHAVVARSMVDAIALDGIDLGSTPPRSAALISLDGPPSLDVSLVFEAGVLYFNDEGPQIADRRARRARLAWVP